MAFERIFEYDIADILPNNRYSIRLLLVYSLPALGARTCPGYVITPNLVRARASGGRKELGNGSENAPKLSRLLTEV